ncbi:hypothetical protein BC828DRAFT_409824 [Blastocladiella britannica]|nr:hypothetical protein BC828DRAFT_409824 [Blastocladiella britannica]
MAGDEPHLAPEPNFRMRAAHINGRPETVFGIVQNDVVYFPFTFLCQFLAQNAGLTGDTLYNRIRKRFKGHSGRLILSDSDVARYRAIANISGFGVKIFLDVATVLAVAPDAVINPRLDVELIGPELTGNESPETVAQLKPRADGGTGGGDEDDDGNLRIGSRRRAGARASASASSSALAGSPAPRTSSRQGGLSSTADRQLPVIGKLFPRAAEWPEVFTPHTLEIKVTRQGQQPHFVVWSALNPTDKFHVFRATIDSTDPVLVRKRPWLAKFLRDEFDDQDLAHYEAKLDYPLTEHLDAVLADASLPSDAEIMALTQAYAATTSLKRRAMADLGADGAAPASKRRRTVNDAAADGSCVPDHLHHFVSALIPSSGGDDEYHDGAQAVHALDPVQMTQSVQQLVQSLGSFYYDMTMEYAALRAEVQHARAEREALTAALRDVQATLASVTGHPPAAPLPLPTTTARPAAPGPGAAATAPRSPVALPVPVKSPTSPLRPVASSAQAPAAPKPFPVPVVSPAYPPASSSTTMPNEGLVHQHHQRQQISPAAAAAAAATNDGDRMDLSA